MLVIKGLWNLLFANFITLKTQLQRFSVLHLKHFIESLDGIISGGMSVEDFSIVTKTDPVTAKIILEILVKNNIGQKVGDNFNFNPGDKLRAGIYAINQGASIDEISPKLEWKDFEGLVAQILNSKDFATIQNLILTKPRREIDVVGIRLGIAMLIDCKHWKRYSISALNSAVKKQIERTKQYVEQTQGSVAVPVIVTLYQDNVEFINRVPIVPILQFSSFVDEFYGNLDDIQTIESRN